MKYLLSAILGVILYLSGQEIVDLQEAQRYTKCTLETNQYDKCQTGSSWLYKNYPEGPKLFTCVFPGQPDRKICKILGIKKSL